VRNSAFEQMQERTLAPMTHHDETLPADSGELQRTPRLPFNPKQGETQSNP
jgi:hypothetical protein